MVEHHVPARPDEVAVTQAVREPLRPRDLVAGSAGFADRVHHPELRRVFAGREPRHLSLIRGRSNRAWRCRSSRFGASRESARCNVVRGTEDVKHHVRILFAFSVREAHVGSRGRRGCVGSPVTLRLARADDFPFPVSEPAPIRTGGRLKPRGEFFNNEADGNVLPKRDFADDLH